MDESTEPFALAEAAAAVMRRELGVDSFDAAVVLGSGWAEAADQLGSIIASVALATVPGFPVPTVQGHRSDARAIDVNGRRVLVLGGRVHLYEGHPASLVVHPVRTAHAAGCATVILTNAAGGLDPDWGAGQPVLISDQLNLTGTSPLTGPAPPPDRPGRFADMSDAYSPRLRELARSLDELPEGVYAGLLGGVYETPAEVRMLAGYGADLVGMSTVLETIAARHLDMEVLGLSLVTNPAAGMGSEKLDHGDVLAQAEAARPRVIRLLRQVLENLPGPA